MRDTSSSISNDFKYDWDRNSFVAELPDGREFLIKFNEESRKYDITMQGRPTPMYMGLTMVQGFDCYYLAARKLEQNTNVA